ncbi:MAG: RDD family protein, partial [Acidimicrobiales bacterium]
MAQPPGIVTPEAVVLQFETGGVSSRLLAGLIDTAIQFALVAAFFAAFGGAASMGLDAGGLGTAMVLVAMFLILFGYPVVLETFWRGRTVGKAALGLRVVTVEGAPVRFRHAAIRSVMGLLDKWLLYGVVGLLAILLSGRNQRLGDLVAGTIVLRERSGAGTPRAVAFPVPFGLEAYTATLDPAGVGADEYAALRSFLLRAPALRPEVARPLARQLADPLVARLHTVPPPGVGPELFMA